MTQIEKEEYFSVCAQSMKEAADRYKRIITIQQSIESICNDFNVPYKTLISLLDSYHNHLKDEFKK